MSDPARAYIARLTPHGANYLEAIREGLQYIDFGRHVSGGTKVFLKPNLTFPTYKPGVMTSPAAVEAAIVAVKDYTDEVWIGDSDSGGYNRFSMDEVYRATGIADFAGSHGVEVVNLSKVERRDVEIDRGDQRVMLPLPVLLTDEIDLLVTLPVPKIHMNTGVSLTFKNQWGCIPENEDRLRLHPFFTDVVLEINRVVKAYCAIVDGRVGLNSSGPLRGQPIRLDWLCVAKPIGAGARVCLDLMQIPVEKVRHLKVAAKRGLLPEIDDIELNTTLAPFRGPRFFLKRKWTDYPGLLAFRNPRLAQLAYFSPWAGPLHRLLYRFREPFYDYDRPHK